MHRGGCAVAMLTGPLFLGMYQKWGLSFVQNAVVETVTLSLPQSFRTKHRHLSFISFRWLLPAISAAPLAGALRASYDSWYACLGKG